MMPIISKKKKTKILLVYPNQMLQNLIAVNLSLLSACLKKEGFEVEIFDTTFYKTEDESGDEIRIRNLQVRPFNLEDHGLQIKKEDVFESFNKMVNNYKPNLIGYTVTDDTFPLAHELMLSLKDYKALTIVGGPFATFATEKAISYPEIDIVCTGEGEEALLELAEAIETSRSYNNIKNLWVKEDGNIIKNPLRPLIDLDSLPLMDFSIWEKERFYRPMQGKVFRMAPIYTDRGCPNLCTYCCAASYGQIYRNAKLGNYLRFRSTKNLIREVKFLIKKYSIEYIYFSAETFLLLKDNLFSEFIKEYKKINLPFWFQSRPEKVSRKKINDLIKIGADRVTFGLESGNEEYRKTLLRRNFSNEEVIRCFDIVSEEGLKTSVNNIIGLPDETRKMIFDTIELNRRLKTDSVSVFYFTPYHGTFLRDYCIQKGYLDENERPTDRRKDTNLRMPQISTEELRGLMRTYPLYVKLDKQYYPAIKKAEQLNEEGNREFEKLSKIFREQFWGTQE